MEVPRIGTAGWSVPRAAVEFAEEGSQLERYASALSCCEINSSFYRTHRAQTYARWAASVPPDFRFAVKAPRTVTHEAKLRETSALLAPFFEQIAPLGAALGPVLVQLPPSLKFDAAIAEAFLGDFRRLFIGAAVIEPRHPSWFVDKAEALLVDYEFGRVAADPACCEAAAVPGGAAGFRYWRLHGSPQIYHTPYGEDRLRAMAAKLGPGDWRLFDNTASGAALVDALALKRLVGGV